MCKLLWRSQHTVKQFFRSLLTYGLQQPLRADDTAETQVWIDDAQLADADLVLATRDYTTLMDVVSEPPSPRPTGIPSPQIPEPSLPPGENQDPAIIDIPSREFGCDRYTSL